MWGNIALIRWILSQGVVIHVVSHIKRGVRIFIETKLRQNVKMDYVIFSRGVVGRCIGVRLGYVVGLKNIASIGKMKPSLNVRSKRRKTRRGNSKWVRLMLEAWRHIT